MGKVLLGVNIDHIATLREARGGIEPEPLTAAMLSEQAGADGITIHLREDRRHIKERDLIILREVVQTKLNLEMALSDEIIKIALEIVPDQITLVPEKREELTTEGGLDVAGNMNKIKEAVAKFKEKGITVSLFVEPDEKVMEDSKESGTDFVELHTGSYSNAVKSEDIEYELDRLVRAGKIAESMGIGVNAGHGLNYRNIIDIFKIKSLHEVNIGHSIISRAVFKGIEKAVKDMKEIISFYRG